MKKFLKNFFEKIEKPENQEKPLTDREILKKGWDTHSISLSNPTEGRALQEYEKQLNFNSQELHGKRILDIGSGIKDKFAREIKELGIDAEVVSLSPDYSIDKYSKNVSVAFPEGKQIAGIGQSLPFADKSFDRVFALHVYEHIFSNDILLRMLGEMVRILKPGGVAKIGPMEDIPGTFYPYKISTDDEKLRLLLEHNQATLYQENMPESIMPKTKVKDNYGNAFYVSQYNIVITRKES